MIDLTGVAPLTVTVDLEACRVISVRVSDEEAEIDAPATDGDEDWVKATEIAANAEWPAWEFGRDPDASHLSRLRRQQRSGERPLAAPI